MADPVITSHHAIAPHTEAGATVEITIDGQAVTAGAGEFLIAAAERAGVFIPRFCYHPRLKPVGMCRMCLVEVSGPRGATLQPACYVAVADQMEVVTTSDKVKKAQDGVLEMLLVNHPLDCPVCDKGGECPLQDQVLAYGPGESRFLEEKRHWAKPIAISELVLLDRERCIQCGRCVRFANEVAGEAQIDFLGRGDAGGGERLRGTRLQLVLQRQHGPDLSGGRPDGHPLPVHRPPLGPRAGRVDLHALRLRVSGRGAVVGQPDHPAARDGQRPGQPVVAVRQGPLRLRGAERREQGDRTPGAPGRRPRTGVMG